MTEPQLVTLGNLADGVAEELFSKALRDALASIDDVNTDWKAKRAITLQFTITADETRRNAFIDVKCATKLPGVKPLAVPVFIGRRAGQLVAVEPYRQEELFNESKPDLHVTEGTDAR